MAWERERVASFLLSERHYLAALEFHQDLLEKEGDSITELNNYFNNPMTLNEVITGGRERESEAEPLVSHLLYLV